MNSYNFKVYKNSDNNIVIKQDDGEHESCVIVPISKIESLIVMLAREVKSKHTAEA